MNSWLFIWFLGYPDHVIDRVERRDGGKQYIEVCIQNWLTNFIDIVVISTLSNIDETKYWKYKDYICMKRTII